jgi:predicted MFS family arabinose efflux permease
MSMSTFFVQFGAAIGAAVGGALLAVSSSYQIVALGFVGLNFSAVAIYLFLTKDLQEYANLKDLNTAFLRLLAKFLQTSARLQLF